MNSINLNSAEQEENDYVLDSPSDSCQKPVLRGRAANQKRLCPKPKRHSCDQCGRQFTLESGLKIHQIIHLPHECNKCGKSLTTKLTSLIYHKCGQRESPHGCEQCGRSFASKRALKAHQRDHIGDFQCEECGCSFIYMNNLHVHQRMHRSHQPFHCDQCGQNFTSLSKLKRHVISHTSGVKLEFEAMVGGVVGL